MYYAYSTSSAAGGERNDQAVVLRGAIKDACNLISSVKKCDIALSELLASVANVNIGYFTKIA